MSAHSVSPSADGTTWAESTDAFAASGMYELSVCQPSLPRKRFEAMLVRPHDRPIGLLVADRHRLLLGVRRQELDIPEAIGRTPPAPLPSPPARETPGPRSRGRLAPRSSRWSASIRKVEAGDDGAQRGIDRRNLWLHGIPSYPAACGWITRESRWARIARRVDSVAPRSTEE